MWGQGIRSLVVMTAVACGLLVVLTGVGEAQLILYDDFPGPDIDAAKWRGQETFFAGDNPNVEAMRYITGGQLRVYLKTYGGPFTNIGSQNGRFGLKISTPELVTAMATTVTVISASAQACTTNTSTSTLARARLHGYFFNDGTSQRIGDGTGDVSAGIQLQRTTTGLNQVFAFISRCDNFDCVSTTTLANAPFTTTWTLNTPITLEMMWDAANHRFAFTATPSGAPPESHTLSYAGLVPVDTDPPRDNDFKRIVVDNSAANCLSGRKRALMDVRFNNVMVNP